MLGVTTGLRALRFAILFLLVAGTAYADAPTGYACPPGVPAKGVGCTCPSGYTSKRDESGIAICAAGEAKKKVVVQLGYDQLLSKANSLADTDCNAAESWYVKALQQKPNGLEALVGSGMCMLELSKFASAHSRFRTALSVNPRYEGALWGVAEAYRKQGKRDEAIASYKQYLDQYPSSYKGKMALEKLAGKSTVDTGGGGIGAVGGTGGTGGDPWGGNKPTAKVTRAADVKIAVTGSRISINGNELTGTPMLADVEAIFGKPDRVWGTGSAGNSVHTWDKLGVIAYEPKDGRMVSLTLPFRPMGYEYDPSTLFAGSIVIDGNPYSIATTIPTAKGRPGATQPYSGTSVVLAKGDFNVFMQGKSETATLDLVELSLWKKPAPTTTATTGKARSTQDMKVAVSGRKVTVNGTTVSGKPMLADFEAILGKPDRVWDQGSGNKVHTWDKLGVIVYEPRDGRAISATFPFKTMSASYEPSTMFGGSIVVDGSPMTASHDLATIKARPGATQPYSSASIVFDRGDIHVFTISKSAGQKLDLVEISFWQQNQNDAVQGKTAPPRTTDVAVTVTGTKVTMNGVAISGKPMVADLEAVFGKPDRVWEKKGGVNRIHTWDKLGLLVYEPFDGRCISATFPFKKMGSDFDPKAMFGGTITVDGSRLSPATTLASVKTKPGATTPYGPTSVVFDKGDIHVFTNSDAETSPIDLVEISFWQKDKN